MLLAAVGTLSWPPLGPNGLISAISSSSVSSRNLVELHLVPELLDKGYEILHSIDLLKVDVTLVVHGLVLVDVVQTPGMLILEDLLGLC